MSNVKNHSKQLTLSGELDVQRLYHFLPHNIRESLHPQWNGFQRPTLPTVHQRPTSLTVHQHPALQTVHQCKYQHPTLSMVHQHGGQHPTLPTVGLHGGQRPTLVTCQHWAQSKPCEPTVSPEHFQVIRMLNKYLIMMFPTVNPTSTANPTPMHKKKGGLSSSRVSWSMCKTTVVFKIENGTEKDVDTLQMILK